MMKNSSTQGLFGPGLGSECYFEEKDGRDMQSRHKSKEDKNRLPKTRNQMKSLLHIKTLLRDSYNRDYWFRIYTYGTQKDIEEAIKRKKNAEKLKLAVKRRERVRKIVYTEAGDDRRITMMRHMRHITSLKSICLDFGRCRFLTDAELRSVSAYLRHLTSLTSISLNFYCCYDVTDAGLRYISECLRHLVSLTRIGLDFSLGKISDAGLRSLSGSLRHLTSLTSVTLNFDGCPMITDVGLRSVSDSLRHLFSLTKIVLDFSACKTMTDAALKYLSDSLRHLTSLACIKLFFDLRSISSEAKKEVRQELKALKSVKMVDI